MVRRFKNQHSIASVNIALSEEESLDQKCQLLMDLTKTYDIKSRKNDRKECLMSVNFVANNSLYNGFIKNISSGGLFIECPRNTIQKLYVSQPITLTFDHPDKKKHIKTTGKIVKIEGSGIGVNFDEFL
jgi:Tfp pilus assembly protein PilZ